MKKILFLTFVSCVVSACSGMFASNTVDMTYDCNPPGAVIFEQGNRKLGACPVTVQYHPNGEQLKEEKFYTRKIIAVWPDGTVASVLPLTVDIPSDHKAHYTLTSAQGTPPAPSPPAQNTSPPPMPPPMPPQLPPDMPVSEAGDKTSPDANGAPLPLQPVDQVQPLSPPVTDNPSIMRPQGAGPVAGHVDQDSFDTLNRKVTCGIDNFIDSVYSNCPK